MKILNFSLFYLSKFKINYAISSSRKISICFRKSTVQYLVFRSHFHTNLPFLSVTSYRLNSISRKSGKIFQERENEYAHQVMENLSYYSNSLLKFPMEHDSNTDKFKESANLSAFDKFIQVTLHNFSKGLNLENKEFTGIVQSVCSLLPEASDEDVKKTLHYLCLWPPTSHPTTENFKVLWNTLDKECVKRMKHWNETYCRKFSKMSQQTSHLVFVYGTLKSGQPNFDLIEKRTEGVATFLGKAKTVKKWPLVIASRYNIPYLLYSEGNGMNVIGEVYEVDDIMLAKLDELECHPEYYTRCLEEVCLISDNESKFLKTWIYFLKSFRSELLKLPCLTEYASDGPHGMKYVSRYNRTGGSNYYSDVMDL